MMKRAEYTEEKLIVSLRPFDIEKCPHLEKSLMHFVDISNQHLMVIYANTFAQYEMGDPVGCHFNHTLDTKLSSCFNSIL